MGVGATPHVALAEVKAPGSLLADGLWESEANAAVAGLDPPQQRDVEQRIDARKHIHAIAANHRLDLSELDRPGEYPEAVEQLTGVWLE